MLRHQWRLALELDLPAVVHNRDSNERMLAVVAEEEFAGLRADFHSFAGGRAMAEELIARDFYLGFTGMITFKRADNVREVIPILPRERELVETDTPYLAPVPHRGSENRPEWVVEIAERLAEERGESYETICQRTTENFFRLFSKARARRVGRGGRAGRSVLGGVCRERPGGRVSEGTAGELEGWGTNSRLVGVRVGPSRLLNGPRGRGRQRPSRTLPPGRSAHVLLAPPPANHEMSGKRRGQSTGQGPEQIGRGRPFLPLRVRKGTRDGRGDPVDDQG